MFAVPLNVKVPAPALVNAFAPEIKPLMVNVPEPPIEVADAKFTAPVPAVVIVPVPELISAPPAPLAPTPFSVNVLPVAIAKVILPTSKVPPELTVANVAPLGAPNAEAFPSFNIPPLIVVPPV